MERRVAVITGASSGIGKSTAKLLAWRGWDVIGQGRDPERCAAALSEIRAAAAPGARVEMVRADLALLSETARAADQIAGLTGAVHALLNNAGGVRNRMIITSEGNEATFAGNHLGHFLLTKRLMPSLRASAVGAAPGAVRVVSVSSLGHEHCPGLDWDDLQQIRDWGSSKAYCAAKLCNLLFTLELSKRTADAGVVALAMHPGVVDSNFGAHAVPEMQAHIKARPGDPPERSAETLAWLADAAEVAACTGGYFHDLAPARSSPAALDAEAAARLWRESEALLARCGY
jgi:NAD(P)-dependent dehydrogenase (short-subunit alcohol dehydrogenase family)